MHPNKKILNSKNSPWLLCPSKSFPGKFYYFNGSTGETAWSLNDADTKNLKKATIPTITDKTHSYPEPLGPPADESTNTTPSSLKKTSFTGNDFTNGPFSIPHFGNVLNLHGRYGNRPNVNTDCSNRPNLSTNTGFGHRSTEVNLGHHTNFYKNVGDYRTNCSAASPMFGQAVFPKYVSSEMCVPKVIWALTPMLIPEQSTTKRMSDQITQYEPQEQFQTNQFQNLKRTVKQNPFQSNTSTPLPRTQVPIFEQIFAQRVKVDADAQTFDPMPKTKEEACQTVPRRSRTRSLSDCTPKTILKPSRSVENLTSIDYDKSLSPNTEVGDDDKTDKLSALEENDLRLLLVAKRRKSVNLDDTPISTKEPVKPNAVFDDGATSKKRVTFDLDDQDTSSSEEDQNGVVLSPDSLEVESLEASGDTSAVDSIWYIAADTTVLLAEFECIEKFVLSDKNCRLLIPSVVKSNIEALSKGDGFGRQSTTAARQVMRKLATLKPHIVVQRQPETVSASEEDAILKCCWQQFQDNYVVLITDNTKLLNKSKIIDIKCHTLNEFKDTIIPTSIQDPFDMRKVKIIVNNVVKPTENLFQQTLKDLNPFGLTQTVEFPVRNIFDKQNIQVNRTIFGGKDENNEKLIDLTNTNKALKNVCSNDVEGINHDISRLEITDQMNIKKLTSKNINRIEFEDQNLINNYKENQDYQSLNNKRSDITVSGIVKLGSVFDLDDELKRFYITSDIMENRVKSRKDEWICRLTQIMEQALTDVLLKEKVKVKKIIPPWSLSEAIQLIGEGFKKQSIIKTIVDKFSMHLFNCSSNSGKLNQNIPPIDFIKLIGFSMILIQNLKQIIDYDELDDADDQLGELIKNIEDPKTDVEFSLESVITPVSRGSDEMASRTPMAYKNKQRDVLEYLKKHFTAMQSYELETDQPKILRTTGRDLNTLKINNNKSMVVENKDDVHDKVVEPKVVEPKVVEPKVIEPKVVEPKVIRNVKIIEAFEEKLKKKAENEVESLDYETMTISSGNNDYSECHEVECTPDRAECSVLEESFSSIFYNECVLAAPLLKTFFTELRRALMMIHAHITESIAEYQKGDLFEEKKSDIRFKTDIAYKYIMKIINRLKSIIARENGDGPVVKELLIQAGDYVEEDPTMARYKGEVTRYLEQAQILEEALKSLLSVT